MSPQRGGVLGPVEEAHHRHGPAVLLAGHGGAGNIEYYDIGGALVVNQTADVMKEVQDCSKASAGCKTCRCRSRSG